MSMRPVRAVAVASIVSVGSLAVLCAIVFPARGQDSSALINQALDTNVPSVSIDGGLPKALQQLEEKTAVPIRAGPEVYDLLPWGEQTNIKATIQNKTLREVLSAITRRLGLTYRLGGQQVDLEPMPALKRLGRRATVEELQVLDQLSATPMAFDKSKVTVKDLVDAVDAKLLAMKSRFAVETRLNDPANPDVPVVRDDVLVDVPRNATVADALEALAKETNLTWYPWGNSIMVVPKVEQVRNQLGKTITRRFNRTDVDEVLKELSRASGVDFQIEPGAIQRVPPEYRRINLTLDDYPVRDALERIKGVTGLDYVVTPTGVYVQNTNATAASGPGAATTAPVDPVVAMMPLDNGMQVLVHERDLPRDVREFIRYKMTREVGHLREMMKAENYKPATQPAAAAPAATQPAPKSPEKEKDKDL